MTQHTVWSLDGSYWGLYAGYVIHVSKLVNGDDVAWHARAYRNGGGGRLGDYWKLGGEFFRVSESRVNFDESVGINTALEPLAQPMDPVEQQAISEAIADFEEHPEKRLG